MYIRKNGYRKGTENNVPNTIAFTMIKNFLSDKNYKDVRRDYFINNLDTKQVSQAMRDIKWLFKEYKGLDVVTIENVNGDVNKIRL